MFLIDEAAKRGAQFAVSPGATEALIDKAKTTTMPFVPGAAMASDILARYVHGYRLQMFPR